LRINCIGSGATGKLGFIYFYIGHMLFQGRLQTLAYLDVITALICFYVQTLNSKIAAIAMT